MSARPMSSFLRTALLVDAAATAATGLLLAAGAPLLSSMLGLPASFLLAAGLPLLPFAAFVAWLGTRTASSPAAIHAVVWSNAFWVAASVGIVAARVFEPTVFGIGFILAQAAAVGAFATFQFVGLRRAHV
jgi:hypothetical protein